MGSKLSGIVVAMVTPFNKDETLDEGALRAVVQFLIGKRVHGLFPGGSQGEFFSLDAEERRRVLEITVEETQEEAFVVAHTGAITTREAVALTQHAEAVGADAVAAINAAAGDVFSIGGMMSLGGHGSLQVYDVPAETIFANTGSIETDPRFGLPFTRRLSLTAAAPVAAGRCARSYPGAAQPS